MASLGDANWHVASRLVNLMQTGEEFSYIPNMVSDVSIGISRSDDV